MTNNEDPLNRINLTIIFKCTDKESIIKEGADRSNVSNGAEIENIHFKVFQKLAIGIQNITKYLSKYQGPVGEGKNPKTTNENSSCPEKHLVKLITLKISINHGICKLLEDKTVKECMYICQKELMSSQSTFLL